jgi:hypothetical protein
VRLLRSALGHLRSALGRHSETLLRRASDEDRHLLLHIVVYHEPVRDGSTQGHEAKRTGECGGSSKEPYNRYYSFSVNQSIDYPHKCKLGFHSVLANTLKQLDMIQGLGSTSPSNRLPSLTRMVHLSSIDRRLLVPLIGLFH